MSCNTATHDAEMEMIAQGSSGIPLMGHKRPGYWLDFTHLEKEILDFIRVSGGEPGVMPKLCHLEAAGKKYLLRPIRNFGGIVAVAARMRMQGAWKRDRSDKKLASEIDLMSTWESEAAFVSALALKLKCNRRIVWDVVVAWKGQAGDGVSLPLDNPIALGEVVKRTQLLVRQAKKPLASP